MGGALVKGWVAQKLTSIVAVEPAPSPDMRDLARRHAIRLVANIEDALDLRVSACVIALKPQILRAHGERLKPIAASGALMVSIAAGTSIAGLRKSWGRQASIVRAMPNTPGSIGHGITALYAPPSISPALRARAETLVAGLGQTFWVGREALIDAVTAVSGSGPAYVFLMAECLSKAARKQGFSADIAAKLARATVSGAGALLDADTRDPSALRRDVMSPGGTTEAALGILIKDSALETLMTDAVSAARARAQELRRQSEN
jgi:pyrroline-5-carboxylate reductase